MKRMGMGVASRRVGALALTFAAMVGCGDNGVTPPDAPVDIDAPPPAPAVLSVSPLTRDFGSVTVDASSAAMAFTVTNTGGSDSGSISASLMGSGSSPFSIESNGCTTLAANATCTVSVAFHPTAPGARTANLVVSSSPGGSVSASLDGTGVEIGELTINPSTNAFGDVVVGATSTSTATFTVRNTGGTTTGTLNVAATGSDPGSFDKASDSCNGQTLAANATCTITVSFAPTSPGAKSASFTITGEPGGTVTAAVSGNGRAPALVSINPSLQNFGSVVRNQQSSTQTFTVTNTGGVATGALGSTLAGTDQGQFTIVSGNCEGVALNPNATCNIVVRFDPTTVGAKGAQLNVTGTPGNTASATLLGTGIEPGQITITPTTFDFPDTTVGATSASQMFTVTNTGGAATGALATALGGNNANQFTIVNGSNGCQGVVLATNGSCTIVLTFTPTTGGAKSANITVSGTPGGTAVAGLSGDAIPPALLSVSPASTDFGSVGTGTVTSYRTFTITNIGGQTTGTPMVALNGPQAGQFQHVSGCNAALAPNAACTVQVRFAPSINGNAAATLDVSATPGGSISAGLFGQGVDPAALAALPTSLAFDDGDGDNGEVLVGETQQLTFLLRNNGTEPTGTIAFSATGSHQNDYAFTHTCTFLPAGQSCTVTVTFAPTAPGTRTASIVATTTPGGSVSVPLTGDALPRLELRTPSTNPFAFNNVIVNTAAPPSTTVTVRNNRSTAVTLNLTPTFGGQFNRIGGTCATPSGSLAAHSSCTVEVNFRPTSLGDKPGAILFSTGAGGINQATQSFTGTGVDSLGITAATSTNFGPVARGTASGTLSFTVTNPANSPATGAIGATISNNAFQIISNGCAGATLAGGASCTIQVRFLPVVGGGTLQTATLAVTAAPGGSPSIELGGTGVEPASLQFEPTATLAFGNVFSGETGNQTIVVSNPAGAAESGPITFSKTGADSGLYTLQPGAAVSTDCVSGVTTLEAGETCNIRVRFSPTGTAFGAKNAATVTISANPGTTSPRDIALTGTSVSTISVTAPASPFDYGDRAVGSTTSQAFTVRNNSNNAVTITSTTPPTGPYAITANTCTGSLAASSTCTVTIRFAPAAAGDFASSIAVNSANGIATASFEGHGNTAPNVSWTESFSAVSPFEFGSTLAGELGLSRTFTLRNTGETTAPAISAILVTDPMQYALTTTCNGVALAPNATCTATLRFTPTPSTAATADVTAQLSAMGVTGTNGTIHVLGRRMETGALTFEPTVASFLDTVAGQVSPTQVITVLNTSGATVTFNIGATVSTAPPGYITTQYSLQGTTCGGTPDAGAYFGATLAPGSSCTVSVQFNPTAAGTITAYLLTATAPAYDVGESPYAPLVGRALVPAGVTVSTTTPTFPTTALTSSSTATITLTNTGDVSTGAITQSAITGPDAGMFSKSGCTGPLAPGAACTLTVTFTPANVGAKSASFTIGATPGLATQTINLSATAVTNATLGISPTTQQNAGSRAVGALDAGGTVYTVTNGGAVPTGDLGVTLSDTNYDVDDSFGTCNFGAPLAAGASCTFRVAFNPDALGVHVTNVIVSASPGASVAGSIPGRGTEALTVAPTMPNFGTVAAGGASATQTLTFTNTADVATGLLYTQLAGTNATQFAIVTDNCAGKVLTAAGGASPSCTIDVRFVPAATGTAGAKSATVTVSGMPGNAATATLAGTAN